MGANKAALLAAILVAVGGTGCGGESETRCYTPGSVTNPGEGTPQKIPDLPCLSRNEAKPYVASSCEDLTVDKGPEQKAENGAPRCCYEVTYEKRTGCQSGRPLVVMQVARVAGLSRRGAWS